MKRLILSVMLVCVFVTPSAAFKMPWSSSSVASLASNPLVASLMGGLGLNANQAVGGAGALLGLAQEKLAKGDWSAISKVIPGASSLISQAKALGGIKKFESLASLAGAFGKMGLTADQVKSVQGSLSDAISKSNADLAKKFNDVIK